MLFILLTEHSVHFGAWRRPVLDPSPGFRVHNVVVQPQPVKWRQVPQQCSQRGQPVFIDFGRTAARLRARGEDVDRISDLQPWLR